MSAMGSAVVEAQTGIEEHAGLYLTFQLGNEVFGLPILRVQEIIALMAVTAVPRTPHFVRGVINLRGKVIPVIELRKKFGMPTTEDTHHTCIIVVEVYCNGDPVTMGLIVDEVAEVVDIAGAQIEPAPTFGVSVSTDFILGMGKVRESVVMLLDVDKVLASGEAAELAAIEEDTQ